MTTARDIVKKSMQKAGVLIMREDPSSEEANDGLDALNAMLSSWSNFTNNIYARVWQTFSLTGGVGEYLMGTGQTFNTVRPIQILQAYVRQATTDYDVIIINDEQFNGITDKSIQGQPQYLNNDNAMPVVKIRLWPIPSMNYSLFLLSEKELGQFDLDDTIILPPGWEQALIDNLSVRLCPLYGQPVSEDLRADATESKESIQTAIMRNVTMDAQPAMQGMWNINTRRGV